MGLVPRAYMQQVEHSGITGSFWEGLARGCVLVGVGRDGSAAGTAPERGSRGYHGHFLIRQLF